MQIYKSKIYFKNQFFLFIIFYKYAIMHIQKEIYFRIYFYF